MMCDVTCGTTGKTYEVETCPCGDRHCVSELANAKNPVESCQDLKVCMRKGFEATDMLVFRSTHFTHVMTCHDNVLSELQ